MELTASHKPIETLAQMRATKATDQQPVRGQRNIDWPFKRMNTEAKNYVAIPHRHWVAAGNALQSCVKAGSHTFEWCRMGDVVHVFCTAHIPTAAQPRQAWPWAAMEPKMVSQPYPLDMLRRAKLSTKAITLRRGYTFAFKQNDTHFAVKRTS